jgi:hypothetical protein
MAQQKNEENWTKKEWDSVIKVCDWIVKEDMKQNSHLYKKKSNNLC